jgi:hypothetical protein
MEEEPIKTEIYYEHPRWLHVVIPYGTGNEPLLVAVCPTCFTYVSQRISVADWRIQKTYTGQIELPQYGCKGPE